MVVEDEAPRLLRALALSQRFHLYIAQCASPRAADRLIDALETELPALRGAPVRVVRLDPYAGQTTDAPLTTELFDTILIPLLAAPEELRKHGTIHVVDASRATSSDDDSWARLFASWNEKRNLLQQFKGEVVVLLPRSLSLVFATDAPDVWSIRSGEYEIGERASRSLAGPGRLGAAVEPAQLVGRGGHVTDRANRVEQRVSTWRLVPPLSLFGGDIVVAGWLRDVLGAGEELGQAPHMDASEDRQLVAARQLRAAEVALAGHRFGEVVDRLGAIVDIAGARLETEVRLSVAMAVALAALDRGEDAWVYADHARALVEDKPAARSGGFERRLALGCAAYVAWCRGELSRAATLDAALQPLQSMSGEDESRLLRAMERGSMREAASLAGQMAQPQRARFVATRRAEPLALAPRLVAADYAFLFRGAAEGRRDAEDLAASLLAAAPRSSVPYADRARALAALLATSDGDITGARRMLASKELPTSQFHVEPAGAYDRRAAFHAYACGVVAMVAADRNAAATWFEVAISTIASWAKVGSERRSIHRAHAATLLAAAAVEADRRHAQEQAFTACIVADRLLGTTGEDYIARVLAVEARWACARYAADPTAALRHAHEAIELAQPLRTAAVESWTALADRRVDDLGPATVG